MLVCGLFSDDFNNPDYVGDRTWLVSNELGATWKEAVID